MKKRDWSTKDNQELLRLIDEHYRQDQKNKLALSRIWEENLRFIRGDQYIRYNKSTHNYEPIPDRIDREYIPRANDNQIYPRCDIVRSDLTRQPATFDLPSNSKDPKDERLSKTAIAVNDCRVEYDNDWLANGESGEWAIATGNAFLKTSWCPTKSIPVLNENGEQETDKDGQPLMAQIGDVSRVAVSPFKIAPDASATSIYNAEVLMEYSLELTNDVKEWYSVSGKGYTGEAKTLGDESFDDNAILRIVEGLKDYHDRIAPENNVILKTVYVKPSDKLKFGRMVVCANNKILFDSDSLYAKLNPKVWHPYSHFRYREEAGCFWGSTPTTQAVKIQRRINAIDTMLILHRQTMALGQWLIPYNSIKEGGLSGRVGLKIFYKPGVGGTKPEKIPGTSIGQDVLLERADCMTSLDALYGTSDVMQAKQPGTIESGVSLEFMREMSFSRFNPMYERWEKFNEASCQLRLNLIANKQSYDIPFFTKMIRSRLRELTGLDINQFIGSIISDNTNIRVQAGSTIPKSRASRMASLQKFAEAGLLGNVVEDPVKNQMFLSEFGITNFKTESNIDYEKSKYELAMIEEGKMPDVHPEDNHEIHLIHFKSKLFDPEYYTSRHPQIIQMAWQHYGMHKHAVEQAKQQQQNSQRQERDETAYVQSIVNSGGPNGDPPTMDMFPTVIEDKMRNMEMVKNLNNQGNKNVPLS